MHTVEILANKKHRVPRWKYGMLSASLDLKNRSMFLLTFAPLPVCAEKEPEPESQPKYICISPNLPNPHSHEGTQPDPQSYLIDPEAWASDIISYIPSNLWLREICITLLKGGKYSLLGKVCYCKTQKHADYRKNPRIASQCLWNVFSLCCPACRNTRSGEGFCCILLLLTKRAETLQHVCCPPHHYLQELCRHISIILGFLMKDGFTLCGFRRWQAQGAHLIFHERDRLKVHNCLIRFAHCSMWGVNDFCLSFNWVQRTDAAYEDEYLHLHVCCIEERAPKPTSGILSLADT